MDVTAIPAFADNYLWLLSRDGLAVVVDPGDARPVLQHLDEHGLVLEAILITHHHLDHIGGIVPLRKRFDVPVYGPRAEAASIPTLTHLLDDGDEISALDETFRVISVPGHTRGHIAYYRNTPQPWLFCGDTLFSAGCGRLFEGTPEQMHDSLSRIAALPDDTRIFCTHEYTLSNLAFAGAVEPENADIAAHIDVVKQLRAQGEPSLPVTLALERRINPFLRTAAPAAVAAAAHRLGRTPSNAIEVFAALRQWKDVFKARPAADR